MEREFDDVRAEIVAKVKDPLARDYALYMLDHGLRYTESTTLLDGMVTGKGGKKRKVYLRPGFIMPPICAYPRLRATLKPLGLKPHDLRKLFATKLVEEGANEFELTSTMGWSNLNTASSYVRASEKKIGALIERIRRKDEKGTGGACASDRSSIHDRIRAVATRVQAEIGVQRLFDLLRKGRQVDLYLQ